MLDLAEISRQDALFEALGNGYRRRILRLVHSDDMSVARIAAKLPISRPAVSKHLRILEAAGLIRFREAGARKLYSLAPGGFKTLETYLTVMSPAH